MKVGYARVSTFDQDLDLQLDALKKEGCSRLFCDQGESRAKGRRLKEWKTTCAKGDVLVIWTRWIELVVRLSTYLTM
ncbi:MAG: recombinase family protein [Cyanobacteria bacterium J06621_11]